MKIVLSIISSVYEVMTQYVNGSLQNVAPVDSQKWHHVFNIISYFEVSNIKQ